MNRLGDKDFSVRFSQGKKKEQKFYDIMTNKYGLHLKSENVQNRRNLDYVRNHTPDFYCPEKQVFFEVKSTYDIRTDLFDHSQKWMEQYGPKESVLYYVIMIASNPVIEFYGLCDLQHYKTQYDQGKWQDGNKFYHIDKTITPYKQLAK